MRVDEHGRILVRDNDGCIEYFNATMPLGGSGGLGLGSRTIFNSPMAPPQDPLIEEEQDVVDRLFESLDENPKL